MVDVQHRNRQHELANEVDRSPGEAQCPYCGQPISRKEYKDIQARIQTEERDRIAKIEADSKARVAREVAKAESQAKAAIEKAKRDAAKIADAKLNTIRANQEATIAAQVKAAREAGEKKTTAAVNTTKLQHAAEKLRLESALADMQRRLQAKTAHQIGEPAEIDLYEALVAAFPNDRVSRFQKGEKGADVRVEIVHQDGVIGTIVLERKAHARWSNKFTTKLRADQLAAGADFAVLVATVFPTGARELHLQDNVVVVSPARAVVTIQLLRRHIVETHRLRITGRARNEKAEELLAWFASPRANDLMDQLRKAADDLIGLEVREVDQHHGIWRRRGELIRVVQKSHEDLVAGIDAIIARGEPVSAEEEVTA